MGTKEKILIQCNVFEGTIEQCFMFGRACFLAEMMKLFLQLYYMGYI